MTRHLIHIGYPKAGSNFLRRWFAKHPQLSYADGGIAGFHNVYEIAKQGAAPLSGILYRVTSSEGLATPHVYVGERTVSYDRMRTVSEPEAQAEVCTTLAALFPNAHVLLVTRGFRSGLFSGFSQYVRTCGEFDFHQLAEMYRHASANNSYEWDYNYLIRIYREAFGDRLIVVPYELMRDNQEAFTRELEKRLGLAHCPAQQGRVNESLSPVELCWYPRLTRFVRSLPVGNRLRRLVFKLYARGTMNNRFRLLIQLLQRFRPASPITADLITDAMLEQFRGKAECLRGEPLYAPYEKDYLL